MGITFVIPFLVLFFSNCNLNERKPNMKLKSNKQTVKDKEETITEGRVLIVEAEIGERRSVGEALKNRIKITRIAEILQP